MQFDILGDLTMTLKQTRLVTADVPKLTQFYENVSQSKARSLTVATSNSRMRLAKD
jgi:hypothetical protein